MTCMRCKASIADRSKWADARGTVLVEILIAFMPLFVLFLGIVQYSLLAVAQLVVQHAAVAGARSASVVLDDDPALYEDQERLEIGASSANSNTAVIDALQAVAQQLGTSEASEQPPFVTPPWLNTALLVADSPRMAAIRTAVHSRLAAIVPARALHSLRPTEHASRDVSAALGSSPTLRLLQAPFYLPIATSVTFPREPGGDELFTHRVEPTSALTVRVTHVVLCEIPITAQLMCGTLASLRASNGSSGGASRLRVSELAQAPGAAFQALWLGTSARMKVVQAEATIPLQTARYLYPSELPSGGDDT